MTETQAKIVSRLERMLDLAPDMRVGQLVSNLASMARPDSVEPTPNVEDEEFLEACDEHLANLERLVARRAAAASPKSLLTTDH